jgi:hypothetical protein
VTEHAHTVVRSFNEQRLIELQVDQCLQIVGKGSHCCFNNLPFDGFQSPATVTENE